MDYFAPPDQFRIDDYNEICSKQSNTPYEIQATNNSIVPIGVVNRHKEFQGTICGRVTRNDCGFATLYDASGCITADFGVASCCAHIGDILEVTGELYECHFLASSARVVGFRRIDLPFTSSPNQYLGLNALKRFARNFFTQQGFFEYHPFDEFDALTYLEQGFHKVFTFGEHDIKVAATFQTYESLGKFVNLFMNTLQEGLNKRFLEERIPVVRQYEITEEELAKLDARFIQPVLLYQDSEFLTARHSLEPNNRTYLDRYELFVYNKQVAITETCITSPDEFAKFNLQFMTGLNFHRYLSLLKEGIPPFGSLVLDFNPLVPLFMADS